MGHRTSSDNPNTTGQYARIAALSGNQIAAAITRCPYIRVKVTGSNEGPLTSSQNGSPKAGLGHDFRFIAAAMNDGSQTLGISR